VATREWMDAGKIRCPVSSTSAVEEGEARDNLRLLAAIASAVTTPVMLETMRYAKLPALPRYRTAQPSARAAPALETVSLRLVKPMMDALLVVVTAPLWLPLCCIIALLVWLEDGACPFFLQRRVGRNGRPFTMLKFRTMVPNAAEVLRKELLRDGNVRHDWNETYKLKRDPRITRIGGLLRRYSLDELPQLLNVALGHMSLVGPRPLPEYHHSQLTRATVAAREQVKPGLTGLWQVSGRSDIGNRGMELWDPFYVRNWSLWLDTLILVRTVNVVMGGRGAY
jgi:lipopolysaccharide/colanic/teichoic acid biosynthesis glycosyltransferase